MNKFYLIFLVVFYLATGSITQAVENPSMPSDNTYAPTDPGRVLVLYDNPMEEHTVISVLIARGYNIKIEKELDRAIEVLKKGAARIGAHAVIILPPDHNENIEPGIKKHEKDANISAKAIRYEHFYY